MSSLFYPIFECNDSRYPFLLKYGSKYRSGAGSDQITCISVPPRHLCYTDTDMTRKDTSKLIQSLFWHGLVYFEVFGTYPFFGLSVLSS
ncbi:F-box protein SKIP1-like [Iris pallida]|uniref:F-box protein SKIP1-like n=1 Tax=Iris pallida TaxID=29817 RepID=A0AAX6HY29_IRIPA|nr:F-box protein SKIP1-like [Iris pallida]